MEQSSLPLKTFSCPGLLCIPSPWVFPLAASALGESGLPSFDPFPYLDTELTAQPCGTPVITMAVNQDVFCKFSAQRRQKSESSLVLTQQTPIE